MQRSAAKEIKTNCKNLKKKKKSSHIFSFGRFGCVVSEFPSGPLVKTPSSQCRGHGFDPWSGN